ncbi:hypothetical protein B5F18_05130 [Lachnoclostridium sp. An181]|nr:hypothetical protein B5F18_05130 [Lachnoclostridium sp. An181]
MILCAVVFVFCPITIQSGKTETSVWQIIIQALLIMSSVIFWILLLGSDNEKRVAYGLKGKRTHYLDLFA